MSEWAEGATGRADKKSVASGWKEKRQRSWRDQEATLRMSDTKADSINQTTGWLSPVSERLGFLLVRSRGIMNTGRTGTAMERRAILFSPTMRLSEPS